MVGINHVALEVGNLDEALEFYGQFLEIRFRNRFSRMAFLDMGDQFIAVAQHDNPNSDEERHFGLVVDDMALVRRRLKELGADILDTSGLEFRDPWGNRIQIVEYGDIQFSKTDAVLRGLAMDDLTKTDAARQELADKGMGEDAD
ncbi:MAG: VOC family protein [Acidobacteria bacterium]|nr:VOC family protein [Acidobacteriota bacterium]